MNWILAHFIGDFLLQNDYIAINKKKSSLICTLHVILYMIPFLFTNICWYTLLLIAAQHWIQDRTQFVGWYCKYFGIFQGELKQNVLPWGHFIVDQIFHISFMYLIIEVL